MDGDLIPSPVRDAPFREPRYAPRRLEVTHREDGALVLQNTTPWSDQFSTTNAALDHWVEAAPDRLWVAERDGDGWRGVTFGEAGHRVARLATALKGLGLGPDRPLLILARNTVDHALIAYAAMRLGCPVAPLSPQYGQASADPARLAHATALIGPAAVYVEDGAAALARPKIAVASMLLQQTTRPRSGRQIERWRRAHPSPSSPTTPLSSETRC